LLLLSAIDVDGALLLKAILFVSPSVTLMIQTVLDRAVERLFLSTALFVQLIILTGCVNMDFLRQGFESYRLTDRQTDRQTGPKLYTIYAA